jgi:hypothetical protein
VVAGFLAVAFLGGLFVVAVFLTGTFFAGSSQAVSSLASQPEPAAGLFRAASRLARRLP